ncbi:MAG: hypothetical protein IC227_08800 [Enterococcus lacertideformus]|uniref:Uncharacterized protein n=1 Tax=Enterococcus lacertideformus TaxID=2771493 RepID=A0A931AWH4_9ENTE|nr:hypothetical protein [Enterococcus lacertideformus]
MKWKEKVDEAAEKIYDLIKSEKYQVEVHFPKKSNKTVQIKSKRSTNHTKNGCQKIANNNKISKKRSLCCCLEVLLFYRSILLSLVSFVFVSVSFELKKLFSFQL